VALRVGERSACRELWGRRTIQNRKRGRRKRVCVNKGLTGLGAAKIASMPFDPNTDSVNYAFLKPLEPLLAQARNLWYCPELPDDEWVRMGVYRVLESSPSGRAFLQEHGLEFEKVPSYGNYFASLRSPRRRDLALEISEALIGVVEARVCDRLGHIPELERYACFAADGHWHQAAAHDPRHQGSKTSVGHFYSLNLRTHTFRHLTVGEGLHEHDMSALKRIKPRGLRQGVAKGTRVLMVYDKAGIDLDYWKRCRQECALYFLSRPKENMIFEWVEDRPWDRSDARNLGVLSDRTVRSRQGHPLRLVLYQDALSGQVYEFLTNEPDLPPGVLVELYRRRWEAEKVFDQVKNKLGQKKAWGTSLVAKQTQALMIAITHNLLILYEQELEQRHQITNTAEDQRRERRLEEALGHRCGSRLSVASLVLEARRATQRSVKFIRWLRQALRGRLAEAAAVPRLKDLYATL
jgi:hypothetical protein